MLTEGTKVKEEVLPIEILQPISVSNNGEAASLQLKDVVERAETRAIIKALEITNNNKSKSAELLGVDRKTLYNKMNSYGLLDK